VSPSATKKKRNYGTREEVWAVMPDDAQAFLTALCKPFEKDSETHRIRVVVIEHTGAKAPEGLIYIKGYPKCEPEK
jgi:hypothetical protein